MLAGILFLALILAVAVLIAVDVRRTPTEVPAGQADRHGQDIERPAGARSGTGVHAFSREPAVREKSVPNAAGGLRSRAGPAEVASFDRPDETARAFDQMHRETSQSATSEAAVRGKLNAVYMNLSRRSQALVERQLRLIESLEQDERDEHRLARLSKLDRIAMRMYRNSQNLLVLAGQEPVTNWSHPVTLAHLVEAAVSEIEDYERVSFVVQPDIAVRGPVVHDAVHLLAELIDNATSFSTAEMPVHIKGRILTSGGALIDITDRGIGMAAKEMAYVNQQLDNPPAPDIDIPKWMGLLVVARLAARHGIRVRLNPTDLGGLTALVWFPDEILTHYGAAVDPGQAAAEHRAAAVSPTARTSARMTAQDAPAARLDPAWSARGSRVTETQAGTRGLPIFDEVESRLSRGGRDASGSAGLATAPSPAASGLPRRPPTGAPRTVPGTPPGAPNRPGAASRDRSGGSQRGVGSGWAPPAEEATASGQDES